MAFPRLLRRRRGAAKLEYALLALLLGGVAVGGLAVFGPIAGRLLGVAERPGGPEGPAAQEAPPPLEFLGQPLLAWQTSGDGFRAVPGAPEERTLELVNFGTGPSGPIGGVAVGPAPFSLVATDCAGPLGPMRACFATVRYAPLETAAHAGAATPGAGPVLPLSGEAEGFLPALAWSGGSPFLVDRTAGPGSLSSDRAFTLTNAGTGRAAVPAPTVSGGGYALLAHDCPAVLDPGQSCVADVRLTADRNGAFPGMLAAGDAAQPLVGSATGLTLAFSWSGGGPLALGAPATTPAQTEQTFTLANSGTLAGAPPAPVVSGAGAGYAFSLAATTCGATLAPGETCTATVRATYTDNVPAATGVLAAGAALLPLSGSAAGFAPAFAWSGGDSFALTDPATNPAAVERTFTLTNVGTLAGIPATPAVSGAGAGFAFSLASHTCGGSLAVGGTCTATVRAIYTDNAASAAGVLASGTAAQPLAGSAAGFAAAYAWSGGGTFVLTAPASNPATLERTFTLTNVGTLAGSPATPAVSGAGAGFAFSLASHTCGGSLAAGGTCTATVRATYTDNVASATGTLGGPATQALAGSASGFAPAFSLVLESSFLETFSVTTGSGDNESSQTNGRLVGVFRIASIGTSPGQIQGGPSVASGQTFAAGTCPAGPTALTTSTLALGQSCTFRIRGNDLGQAVCGQGFSEPFSLSVATSAGPRALAGTLSGSNGLCGPGAPGEQQ